MDKLTPNVLRNMVLKEVASLKAKSSMQQMKDAAVAAAVEEVEPKDLADTLVKDIDHVKALKLEETKLIERLNEIRESKRRTIKSITKRIRSQRAKS